MRTAIEILNKHLIRVHWSNIDPKELSDIFQAAIDALNEARKETIEECANKAKVESILELINYIK